jgi:uncharacterized membrane protein
MAWVPIASMANLCGISTAPAVTAAFEKQWMPHAIVLAILSMVSGTRIVVIHNNSLGLGINL